MSMYTFKQLQDQVQDQLARFNMTNDIKMFINESYVAIVGNNWKHYVTEKSVNFNTVASTRTYALSTIASDIWFVKSLRDTTNKRKLAKHSWRSFEKTVENESTPSRYDRFGSDIILDPTPDAIVTIRMRYGAMVTLLSADADVPITDHNLDEEIKAGAVWRGFQHLREFDKAKEIITLHPLTILPPQFPQDLEQEDLDFGLEPEEF